MKSRIGIIREIESEVTRFTGKLNIAIAEQMEGSGEYQSKKYAAAKRAALDLKNELTKLTQDAKYRYGN